MLSHLSSDACRRHFEPADNATGGQLRIPLARRLSRRRRGSTLLWVCVAIPLFFALGLFSVDAGAIFTARSELQLTVDAAARFGAQALRNGDHGQARANVHQSLTDNLVAGNNATLTDADIEFGLWDPVTRTMTVLPASEAAGATAIRVTARVTRDSENAVGTMFGSLVGLDDYELTATATATIGSPLPIEVQADSCPYLAGMRNGDEIPFTWAPWYPDLPSASTYVDCPPTSVSVKLRPGETVYFRDVEGSTGDTGTGVTYTLEGNTDRILGQAGLSWFSRTDAPLNALMGVFLDDNRPTTTITPAGLNFGTATARDQLVIQPKLKQIFFIGDGVRNTDGRIQKFIVPDGATRLFLGTNDEHGNWFDNFGSYRTTLYSGEIQLVN